MVVARCLMRAASGQAAAKARRGVAPISDRRRQLVGERQFPLALAHAQGLDSTGIVTTSAGATSLKHLYYGGAKLRAAGLISASDPRPCRFSPIDPKWEQSRGRYVATRRRGCLVL
jgi:hypothetical protein